IEDGYCNVCGLAAAPVPAAAPAGSASAPAGSASVPAGSASAPAGSMSTPAGSASAGSGSAVSRRTSGTRSSRRTSGRSARGRLAAGLVEIPPVPYRPRRAWRRRAQLDVGNYDGAGITLSELAAEDPSDWRIAWTDGLRWLAVGNARTAGASGAAGGAAVARNAFNVVYDELPGE